MDNLKKRKLQNKLFHGIVFTSTLFGLVVLVLLLSDVLKEGLRWIDIDFLTNYASRFVKRAGIKAPLFGSLWIIVLTGLFSFPIGVGAAIYLENYAPENWITKLIQVNISNLAGVPSIVFGILGLGIFVNTLGFGRSIISGALTLTLLILPIIIVAAQEAIKSVPKELVHGAYALGTTKWQMITGVILPYAMPGILTGTILALSRALGETAPLLMVGAVTYIAFIPKGITDAFTTLPMQIYNWTSMPQADFHSLAAAGIIVLLTVLLAANALAVFLRNRYESRMKG